MKKTLVYLEEDQLKRLRARARASNKSVAAMVREAVAAWLGEAPPKTAYEVLGDFIGCAEGSPEGNDSERADEIVHNLILGKRRAPGAR